MKYRRAGSESLLTIYQAFAGVDPHDVIIVVYEEESTYGQACDDLAANAAGDKGRQGQVPAPRRRSRQARV